MSSVCSSKNILAGIFSLLFLSGTQSALAINQNGSTAQAKVALLQLRQEMKKMKRLLGKPGVRSALVKAAASARDLQDSDGDGLPDVLEGVEGTDSCRTDSDGDGISDGDEEHAGSNPANEHSGEIEVHAVISAISENTVTVDGHLFTVSVSSRFRGHDNLGQFSIGDKVEVNGRMIDAVLILKSMSLDD